MLQPMKYLPIQMSEAWKCTSCVPAREARIDYFSGTRLLMGESQVTTTKSPEIKES